VQPAVDLCDPARNPRAKGLPPLATVSPRPDALRLYFRSAGGSGSDRRRGEFLMPSEDLRARVEALLRETASGPFGAIFSIVKSVAVEKDAIELRFRDPATDLFRTETELWSRRLLYRIVTSIPRASTSRTAWRSSRHSAPGSPSCTPPKSSRTLPWPISSRTHFTRTRRAFSNRLCRRRVRVSSRETRCPRFRESSPIS